MIRSQKPAQEKKLRAELLLERSNGWTWVFVPEANIQVHLSKNGLGEWVLAAFRTDGYYRGKGKNIPIVRHIRETCDVKGTLDVPGYIVAFAVESERERMAAVDQLAEILEYGVKSRDKAGAFEMAADVLKNPATELQEDEEQAISEELSMLIARAGGQT